MSSDLDHLIQVGHDISAIRYYVWATGTVLFYDYLLTLTDEIKYVWLERKTFAFWIFMVNRYFPMTYQIWQFAVSYSPQTLLDMKVCDKTAFYPALTFVSCTLLAQVVLTLRMYVVTMKNIPIAVGFAIIAACQFGLGLCAVIFIAKGGSQKLPQIPLETFHICVFVQHKSLEVVYAAISLCFDFLAFTLTLYFISRSKKAGFKISTILRTIAEDATRYFFFIFTSHLVLAMCLGLGRESIQFLSASASGNVVYLPVMISRLLLSLKKAVASQQNCRSSGEPSPGRSIQSLRFYRPRRATESGDDDIPLHTYRVSGVGC